MSVTFGAFPCKIETSRAMSRRGKGGHVRYLGWIAAAFLAGGIVTYALFCREQKKWPRGIRTTFSTVDRFRGRSYAWILALVRAAPQETEPLADGRLRRVWRDGDYSISLLFDENDRCLGVEDERMEA